MISSLLTFIILFVIFCFDAVFGDQIILDKCKTFNPTEFFQEEYITEDYVYLKDSRGRSCLELALDHNNTALAMELAGSYNLTDLSSKNLPLIHEIFQSLSEGNFVDLIEEMEASSSSIDQTLVAQIPNGPQKGRNILHQSILGGRWKSLEILLKSVKSFLVLEHRDSEMKTPAHLLDESSPRHILELFWDTMVRVSTKNFWLFSIPVYDVDQLKVAADSYGYHLITTLYRMEEVDSALAKHAFLVKQNAANGLALLFELIKIGDLENFKQCLENDNLFGHKGTDLEELLVVAAENAKLDFILYLHEVWKRSSYFSMFRTKVDWPRVIVNSQSFNVFDTLLNLTSLGYRTSDKNGQNIFHVLAQKHFGEQMYKDMAEVYSKTRDHGYLKMGLLLQTTDNKGYLPLEYALEKANFHACYTFLETMFEPILHADSIHESLFHKAVRLGLSREFIESIKMPNYFHPFELTYRNKDNKTAYDLLEERELCNKLD